MKKKEKLTNRIFNVKNISIHAPQITGADVTSCSFEFLLDPHYKLDLTPPDLAVFKKQNMYKTRDG